MERNQEIPDFDSWKIEHTQSQNEIECASPIKKNVKKMMVNMQLVKSLSIDQNGDIKIATEGQNNDKAENNIEAKNGIGEVGEQKNDWSFKTERRHSVDEQRETEGVNNDIDKQNEIDGQDEID